MQRPPVWMNLTDYWPQSDVCGLLNTAVTENSGRLFD